jgi:hypothetical protein
MSKEKREMLVRSYLGLDEETEENKIRKPSSFLCCGQNKVNCREESIEEMLYDLEIGYYFRYMFNFYIICFEGGDKYLMDSGIFDLLLDRAEAMVEAFKNAEKDPKKFKRVVDLGIESASQEYLSDEQKINFQKNIFKIHKKYCDEEKKKFKEEQAEFNKEKEDFKKQKSEFMKLKETMLFVENEFLKKEKG